MSLFWFSSRVFVISLHCLCISDINYFVHTKYFIILKSELRLLLNLQSLGFPILENNSIFHPEAWGCLALPFFSLPQLLRYHLLALSCLRGVCPPSLDQTRLFLSPSECCISFLTTLPAPAATPFPPPVPPSAAAMMTFPRADLLLLLQLKPCSISPLTLVWLFTRPSVLSPHSPLQTHFQPFCASLGKLITQGFSLFPIIQPHFWTRGSSY